MVKVTDELVEHLSELSRLELSEEQKEALKKDMQEILDYMRLIDEVDVENVEPMYTPVGNPAPLRKDEVRVFSNVEGIRKNFPKKRDGHAEVPGIHR